MILKVVRYTLANLWRGEVNLSTRTKSIMDFSATLVRMTIQKFKKQKKLLEMSRKKLND